MLGPGDPATQLDRLRALADRGARYMTLTWSNGNDIGGSSGDDSDTRGLTSFGRDVIVQMNRLGVIVDISHVSDPTFWDAIRTTRKPVLASHSSSRALTNVPRNMTDAMLKAVAQNGGAACVNFGASFLDEAFHERESAILGEAAPQIGWPPGARCAPTAPASRRACRCRGSSTTSSTWSRSPVSTMSAWAATSMACPRCPWASRTWASCRRSRRHCGRAECRREDVEKILGGNVLRVLEANEPRLSQGLSLVPRPGLGRVGCQGDRKGSGLPSVRNPRPRS